MIIYFIYYTVRLNSTNGSNVLPGLRTVIFRKEKKAKYVTFVVNETIIQVKVNTYT